MVIIDVNRFVDMPCQIGTSCVLCIAVAISNRRKTPPATTSSPPIVDTQIYIYNTSISEEYIYILAKYIGPWQEDDNLIKLRIYVEGEKREIT